jgi:hypothetical protein
MYRARRSPMRSATPVAQPDSPAARPSRAATGPPEVDARLRGSRHSERKIEVLYFLSYRSSRHSATQPLSHSCTPRHASACPAAVGARSARCSARRTRSPLRPRWLRWGGRWRAPRGVCWAPSAAAWRWATCWSPSSSEAKGVGWAGLCGVCTEALLAQVRMERERGAEKGMCWEA